MDLSFLARGLLIGFTVAAPVGPMSLLTIRRTIAHGRGYGLVSGLGIATADATYGAVAAFGLTAVSAILIGARAALAIVGGGFLVWLGIRTIRARPASDGTAIEPRPRLGAAYLSIFGMTLTNPTTILSFAGIFAGVGLAGHGGPEAALLTLGVFVGSALWWVLLTGAVGAIRGRITAGMLTWVNRGSGAVLLAVGVVAIVAAFGIR